MVTEEQGAELTAEGWLAELERLQVHLNMLDVYGAWLFARAEAAGAAAVMGERSLVEALRKRLGISKAEARKRRRTSRAAANDEVRAGMSEGSLNADQAADLAGADVDEDVRSDLIEQARRSREGADTTRRRVQDAERRTANERGEDPTTRQRRRRCAKRFVDHQGMWNLHLSLDAETGARIDGLLTAENKRLWRSDKDSESDRTPAQRLADAAANLLLGESGIAPRAAGGATTEITVTVGLDQLSGGSRNGDESDTNTGVVDTDGGVPLSIAALRRRACDAEVIPAVLGSAGEVLDLGHAVRTVTKAQRRALALRDGGCVWPGCDAPPAQCDSHHVRHWAHGGASDLANLASLCPTHHHLCHEGGYELWSHPPESGRPGWMIHDSGGMPKWPTQLHHGRIAGNGNKRDRPAPTRPFTNGDVTWEEPSLFADTG